MAKRVMRVVQLLGEFAFGVASAALVFTGLTGLVAGAAGAPPDLSEVRPIEFVYHPPKWESPPVRPEKPELEPPPILTIDGVTRCIDCSAAPPVLQVLAPTPLVRGPQRLAMTVQGADGEPTPLFRIPPEYPPNGRGDGSVLVRFDISKLGTVVNARVVESTPAGMFDRAALRAIERWRYRPAVVEGQAVERRGVQVRLRFQLERA